MPRVTSVVSIPAIELETAWEAVSDFARYPATMRDVLAVAILDREGNAGRSAWRALYRRVGDVFVIAAVGPEAQASPREFERMVTLAIQHMEKLSDEGE